MGNKINSIRHSSSHLIDGSQKYIVFLSWIYDSIDQNGYNSFITKLLKFNSINFAQGNAINTVNDIEYRLLKNTTETSVITSCFVSKNNHIWTMGFVSDGDKKVIEPNLFNVSYYIYVYSLSHMNEPISVFYFNVYPFYDRTFCQLAYLRDEIAVAFYYSWPDRNVQEAYPSFYIAKFENNTLSNYLNYLSNPITVDKIEGLNYDTLLNDLIKISEYKVSFSTMSLAKDVFYIFILEVYEPTELFLRIYEIPILSLYNIKFFKDIREHLYGNHLAFGFSYCNSENCEESDTHYSAFMIFSYPNSTNDYLNVTQYLSSNENNKIEDLNVNLTKYIKIENNIFGYVFSSINIYELTGCDDLTLKSVSNNEINSGYNLTENEFIKFSFKAQEKSFNCTIYFRYVVTEPDYLDHINYYISNMSTDFDYKSIYNNHKTKYLGKISFYNIFYEYKKPVIPTTIIQNKLQTTLITQIETEKKIEYINNDIETIKIDKTEKQTYIKEETEAITHHINEISTPVQITEKTTNECKTTVQIIEKITNEYNHDRSNIITENTMINEEPKTIGLLEENHMDYNNITTLEIVNNNNQIKYNTTILESFEYNLNINSTIREPFNNNQIETISSNSNEQFEFNQAVTSVETNNRNDSLNDIYQFVQKWNNITIDNLTNIKDIISDNSLITYLQEESKIMVFQGVNNNIFQITLLANEKELLKNKSNNINNLSIIDFEDCEKELERLNKEFADWYQKHSAEINPNA